MGKSTEKAAEEKREKQIAKEPPKIDKVYKPIPRFRGGCPNC